MHTLSVQGTGGIVQEQDTGIGDDSTRNCDTLLLIARQQEPRSPTMVSGSLDTKLSEFALIHASLMSFNFYSSEACSWTVSMRPWATFPLMVVANSVGSCETRRIWPQSHLTMSSLISMPSNFTSPASGS